MVGLRKTELTRQPLRSRRSRGVGVSSRLGSAPRWGLTCSLTHPSPEQALGNTALWWRVVRWGPDLQPSARPRCSSL